MSEFLLAMLFVIGAGAWDQYERFSPNSRRNQRRRWWDEAEREAKRQVKKAAASTRRCSAVGSEAAKEGREDVKRR